MQEMHKMQVRSLSWEDRLEKEMASQPRVLAWNVPWTEEPGGLQSVGQKDLDMIAHPRMYVQQLARI